MTKFEAHNKANEFLVQALADLKAGNLFLAKSYLRDALSMSNKARTMKRSGLIMLAMGKLEAARA